MNEVALMKAIEKALKELKPAPVTTKIAEGGSRNPWASCNIITEKGAVYRVEVKRLVA